MKKIFLLAVITILFAIGCSQSEDTKIKDKNNFSENEQIDNEQINQPKNNNLEKERKILAKVNGVPIYEDQLKGRPLDRLIEQEVLYQDGLRKGLDKKSEDKLMQMKRAYVIQYSKLAIREQSPQKAIPNEDIQNYYNKNIDKYTHIYAEEINFPQKSEAENIKKMITDGESLLSITQKYDDPDIKQIKVAEYNNLAEYFKTMAVGEVSEIIEKPDGTYSILKISNLNVVPLKSVAPSIKHILEAQQYQEAIDNHIKDLEEREEIKVEYIN